MLFPKQSLLTQLIAAVIGHMVHPDGLHPLAHALPPQVQVLQLHIEEELHMQWRGDHHPADWGGCCWPYGWLVMTAEIIFSGVLLLPSLSQPPLTVLDDL